MYSGLTKVSSAETKVSSKVSSAKTSFIILLQKPSQSK